MLKKISTAFILGLVLQNTCMAMPAFLEPANIIKQIKAEIAKARIDKDITILDKTMINGIGQGIKYRYDSEPSYVDQFYTRLDQYTLNANANIGTLLGADTTPFGFSISRGTDITFARQFKSQLDSVLALPYTPMNIPFTAEKMKQLNNGDFVSFTTTLNMIANINSVIPVATAVNVSLGAYALIQGQFIVNLFKIDENNFRVKIIAVKTNSKGLSAGISLFTNPILTKVKQIVLVGGKISKFVDITPLVANASNNRTNLVMFDYVFNLNDSRAIEAYDNFSIRKVIFKDTGLANPLKDFDRIDDYVMTDLTEVDAIAREDAEKPAKERAIDRIFAADNNSKTKSANVDVKFNIIDLHRGHSYTQNKIKSTDRQNNLTYYLFDSLSVNSKLGLLFDIFGIENNMTSNLLFKANENYEPEEFADLIFNREIKIKQFTEGQYKRLKSHVKNVLPIAVYKKIQWKEIDFTKEKIVNGFFKNQVIFTKASLAAAPILSASEVYDILKPLLREIPRPLTPPSRAQWDENKMTNVVDWTLDYEIDILNLSTQISLFLDNQYTPTERYNAFMGLKNSEMWRDIAVKFFMTILPQEALENTVRYELVLEAKGIEAMRFRSGSALEGELYKNLMYIQSIISNRSFDLRLLTNESGEFLAK